jgi:predicted membrane protein (TIGR00267 family)
MASVQERLEEWREYSEISKVGQIARRAFANNSFDGVLTMIGVVMGSFVVGVAEAKVILVTGLSTALAIGISGGWGAYLTESAERRQAVRELERVTLSELQDTKIGKASRMAVVTVAAVDGLSPFLSALLVILPFFFAPLLPTITYAYYASIAMSLVSLFALGVYLGKISKEKLILSGVKTTIAGMVCIGLSYLLEQLSR